MSNEAGNHVPQGDSATTVPARSPGDGHESSPENDASFWRHKSVEELASQEGVQPVDEATLDAMGDVWPENEDLDEFLAWLRESRREGRY